MLEWPVFELLIYAVLFYHELFAGLSFRRQIGIRVTAKFAGSRSPEFALRMHDSLLKVSVVEPVHFCTAPAVKNSGSSSDHFPHIINNQ
jgi:hypothetical protein